jgi:hypothetical protein
MSAVINKLEKYDCHFAQARSKFIPIYNTVTLTVKYVILALSKHIAVK